SSRRLCMKRRAASSWLVVLVVCLIFTAFAFSGSPKEPLQSPEGSAMSSNRELVISSAAFENQIRQNDTKKFHEGRKIFRFDTFGDESFWGGQLKLHEAIEGAKLGGVGPGLSPRNALALGLKVDLDALPEEVVKALREGHVNLDDPVVTSALLKLHAVIGVTGFFNGSKLNSVCIHSTVD